MSPAHQFQQLINIKLNNFYDLQHQRKKTPNQSHQHSQKVSQAPATQQQTQVFTQP